MDNASTENDTSAAPNPTDVAEQPAKEPMAKQIAKQGIGIVLAVALLYWTFKDTDVPKLMGYVQQVDMKFVLFTCGTALLSHWLRAWRWVYLLQPLSTRPISIWNSFCAVMYGYAVNLVVPRGGELARLVSISKTESIPWAGVLPTMFIDRLLDIAMLVLLMGLTISKLPPGILDERIKGPLGILMCVATICGLVALPFVGKIGRALLAVDAVHSAVPTGLVGKLDQLLSQFDQGTKSLTSIGNLLLICVFSFAIWGCYLANLYLMICAFHLENLFDFSKTLISFTIGSVGVLVPTPGSVGGYHYLTSQSLQKVAGVGEAQAGAFALVTHLLTFIILACVPAAICAIVQSIRQNKKA
jgi:uncharacterized protein (TIRG00374 family)